GRRAQGERAHPALYAGSARRDRAPGGGEALRHRHLLQGPVRHLYAGREDAGGWEVGLRSIEDPFSPRGGRDPMRSFCSLGRFRGMSRDLSIGALILLASATASIA